MNKKGQAFLEALILSPIILICTYLIVRSGFLFILNVSLDDLVEQALFCELQQKNNCMAYLEKETQNLGLKEISTSHSKTDSYASVYLKATSSLGHQLIKQSELRLDLVD